MKNAPKQYVFSGYSDTDESLLIGPEFDKYHDVNYIHGAENAEIPEIWLTGAAEDHTKH